METIGRRSDTLAHAGKPWWPSGIRDALEPGRHETADETEPVWRAQVDGDRWNGVAHVTNANCMEVAGGRWV